MKFVAAVDVTGEGESRVYIYVIEADNGPQATEMIEEWIYQGAAEVSYTINWIYRVDATIAARGGELKEIPPDDDDIDW
jgi:hypothetical protein